MEETFQTFHRVLSFVGVSIYLETEWDSKLWFGLQIWNFIVGFLTFVFTSAFVIASSSDIVMWIEGACIWTTGVILFISLGVCLFFRKDFRSFLEEMGFQDGILKMILLQHVLKYEVKGKLNELKEMVLKSQEKLLRLTRMLLKTYVASVWLCSSLYICDPIYQMYVTEDKLLRLLAFKMWFPWSLQNFKVYIVSFIFHAYAGYLCCIAYPGLQTTIILLNGQIIRQLRILTYILNHLDELAMELVQERGERWQTCCTVILLQCVDQHIKIKKFSNRLNRICRLFYLTLILVAIMLVCVCSVKIAISEKTSLDTMKYYVHEFCFISMVLLFCFLGQQVENECEKLEEAITEKWYIFERNHKMNMRIFQMALCRRMPIYIFGSITLSLPTFTWFIRTGMSFFTLVMSVLENAEQ